MWNDFSWSKTEADYKTINQEADDRLSVALEKYLNLGIKMRTIVKLLLVISILVTVGCTTQVVTAKAIVEAERLCKDFGGLSHISIDPMTETTQKRFYQVNCVNNEHQFGFSQRK